MNHAYRIVWNATNETWQAVTELARGHTNTRAARVAATSLAFALAGLIASIAGAQGLPTGGQIAAGQGSISSAGPAMTVTQSTGKMAIDWQSFSVGAQNKVEFIQPSSSSVALNRVTGAHASTIQGSLSANGQVFLVNPNGVLFTPTSQVNTGGLVASTLELNTSQFMAGHYRFSGASSEKIVNQGTIITPGGTIALIAAKIDNQSVLRADRGQVLLGAGSDITLNIGGPAKLVINKGALDAVISNGGAIQADGGTVLLTAEAANELAASVINNTGLVRARTLATGEKGEIKLLGGMVSNAISVGGTLDASAPSGGDAGFIETSAAYVTTRPELVISAGSKSGKSGLWLIDPYDYIIDSTAASNIERALNIGTSITVTTQATLAGYGSQGSARGHGDIHVSYPITMTGSPGTTPTLTLQADRDVLVTNSIVSTGGPLNITLSAANDRSASVGGVALANAVALDSKGGNILIGGAGGDLLIGGSGANGPEARAASNGIGFARNAASVAPYAVSIGAGTSIKSGGGAITINGWSTQALAGNRRTDAVMIGAGALIDSGNYPAGAGAAVSGGYINITGRYTGGIGGHENKVFGVSIDYPPGNGHGKTILSTSTSSGSIRISASSSYDLTGEYALNMANYGLAGNIAFTAYSTADLIFILNDRPNKVSFDANPPQSGCRTGYPNCGLLTVEPKANNSNLYATYYAVNSSLYPILVSATVDGTKVYDASTTAKDLNFSDLTITDQNATPSGFSASDLTARSFVTASPNVGSYNTVAPQSPLDRTFAANNLTYVVGYNFKVSPEYTITPKTLSLSANKAYDGSPSFAAGQITLSNSVNQEALRLTGAGEAAAATANVSGSNYLTSLGGLTLTDGTGANRGLARNYRLPSLGARSDQNMAEITPVIASISAAKAYDGNTSFAASQVRVSGVNGQSLTLSGGGGATSQSAQVADNNTNFLTSLSGLALANGSGLAINYQLPPLNARSENNIAIINPTNLAILGTSASKIYDGSARFNALQIRLSGILNNDNVSLLPTSWATVSSANAGTYSRWASSDELKLAGPQASNYTLSGGTVNVTITQATASVTASKSYDGTVGFSPAQITVVGINGQTLALAGVGEATARFSDVKGVGPNYLVSLGGLTLADGVGPQGGLAKNYQPPATGSLSPLNTAVITPATASLSAVKTFDGNNRFASNQISISGVNGETLTLKGGANAAANSSQVSDNGSNFITSMGGLQIANGSGRADNYLLPSLSARSVYNDVTILPKSVSALGTNANKTYDGSAVFKAPFITLQGVTSGDDVALDSSTSAMVASANAGIYRNWASSSLKLVGEQSPNYTLAGGPVYATIAPALANLVASKTYDGTTSFTPSQILAFGINGESLSLSGSGNATARSPNVINTSPNYLSFMGDLKLSDGTGWIKGLASNYQMPSLSAAGPHNLVVMTPATASISALKTYDGNSIFNASQITVSGVNGETLALSGAGNASAKSSQVADNNINFLTSLGSLRLANGSGLATNYIVPSRSARSDNNIAIITPAGVGTVGMSAGKDYDGSSIFYASQISLSGIRGSDNVSLDGSTSATVISRDAGIYDRWASSTLVLTGAQASNYTLAGASVRAVISKVPLGIAVTGANYNGSAVFSADSPARDANPGELRGGGTLTVKGLIGNEQVTAVTVFNPNVNFNSSNFITSVSGTNGFNPINYAISSIRTPGPAGVSITNTTNTVDIAAVPLTITAGDIAKTYGQTLPGDSKGFSASGLKGVDAIDRVTLASSGAPATANAGQYALVASNASGTAFVPSNYLITYENGLLAVLPAALVITANNVTKTFGTALPAITTDFTSKGLQNNETIGTVTRASEGLAASAVGGRSYGITLSNAAGGTFSPSNYSITYTPYVVGVSGGAVIVDDLPEPQHIVVPSILVEPATAQTLAPGGLNYIPMVGFGTGASGTTSSTGSASGTTDSRAASPTTFTGVRSPVRQFRAIGQVNDLVTPTDVFVVNGGINIFRAD